MRRLSGPGGLLILSLLLGLLAPPGLAPQRGDAPEPPLQQATVVSAARAVAAATVAGQATLDVDLVVAPGPDVARAAQQVTDLGGRVLLQDARAGYLQAAMPVDRAMNLADLPGLRAMGVDGPAVWRPLAALGLGSPITGAAAGEAMQTNLQAVRQPELAAATGATGSGSIIAFIDTGADPGHPALRTTVEGQPKIVDWQDFSGEGDVDTSFAVQPAGGFVTAPNGRRYGISGITSASGSFHFGFLAESRLDGRAPGLRGDLNHNTRAAESYGILVVDANTPGVYDTIYVDSNNNGDFADQSALVPWRVGRSLARSGGAFGAGVSTNGLELSTSFAVAEIHPDGSGVSIGFDGNGHGTGVASVAAGYDPAAGYSGVAPGAQIMALKVFGSSGRPMYGNLNWGPVSRAMWYAAQNGAQIINVSLDNLDTDLRGEASMSAVLRALVQQYGVLVVLAAGNDGPGLSSGLTPGDDLYVLTAGAYASSDMWEKYHQLTVPGEVLLSFSGVGPRLDGTLVPSLVAPGMSAVARPRWQSSSGYFTDRGTSEAVPHVTGGAALLLDAARRTGQSLDYSRLKRGLEMSARTLDGYQVIEQGHGLINLEHAWQTIQQLQPNWNLRWSLSGDALQRGVLARGTMPDNLSFSLVNESNEVRRVGIVTDAAWLQPLRSSLTLPPGKERTLPMGYAPLTRPGLYSGLVTLMDPAAGGPVAQMVSTVVSPYALGPGNTLTGTGEMTAGRYDRRFVRIPPGTTQLNLDVGIRADTTGRVLGRAEIHVFRPDGREVYAGPIFGAGQPVNGDRFLQKDPAPGLWEIVTVAPPDLAAFNLATTAFNFTLTATGFGIGELPLRLRYASGDTTATVNVPITNRGPAFSGRVEAGGLAESNPSLPSQVVPADHYDKFEMSQGSAMLRINLAGVSPASARVLVSVFHLNLLTQDWDQVASRTMTGSTSPPLDILDPPAGAWGIKLVQLEGSDAQVQYTRTVVAAGRALVSNDQPRLHQAGESWNVPLQVQVPQQPGRYFGNLSVRDSSGELLTLMPVEVTVGQPELAVSLLASGLTQGQNGFVALEVREAGTDILIRQPMVMEVNGRTYRLQSGRLTLPVAAPGAGLKLDVAIASPPSPYLPLRSRLEAIVPAARPTLPSGIAAEEELPAWRQKVATEMQP